MRYEDIKNQLQEMMNENYEDFGKALVSIETNTENESELNRLYKMYMNDDDMRLIDEKFLK